MTPVNGNVSRIMSKYCYMCIESRTGWDNTKFSFDLQQVLSELKFWLDNIIKINCRRLGNYSKSSVIIYSDASNVASDAYTVDLENRIFHTMWTSALLGES